eukprot:TRINITY_DN5812_c0_g1_i1.p1 TRINITY_DN5812_c0_g1~~TRINITY_DN5812_c0_g1_i1.p1  ORF type:complete len:343 (+),score=80.06 TRINITY_DN5812_c0_g1_i1:43-1071(+)
MITSTNQFSLSLCALLLVAVHLFQISAANAPLEALKPISKSNLAYVISLPYTDLIVAAEALVLSVKETGTPHDIILLHTHQIPSFHLDAFRFHGVITYQVPIASSIADRKKSTKKSSTSIKRAPGHYVKIHAWRLLEYRRIILLDPNILVEKNIDALFEIATPAMATFSGKKELVYDDLMEEKGKENRFPTSLMVITPNSAEFESMKWLVLSSPNDNEIQFFKGFYRTDLVKPIPAEYLGLLSFPPNQVIHDFRAFDTWCFRDYYNTIDGLWTFNPNEVLLENLPKFQKSRLVEHKTLLNRLADLFWSSYQKFWKDIPTNPELLSQRYSVFGKRPTKTLSSL